MVSERYSRISVSVQINFHKGSSDKTDGMYPRPVNREISYGTHRPNLVIETNSIQTASSDGTTLIKKNKI